MKCHTPRLGLGATVRPCYGCGLPPIGGLVELMPGDFSQMQCSVVLWNQVDVAEHSQRVDVQSTAPRRFEARPVRSVGRVAAQIHLGHTPDGGEIRHMTEIMIDGRPYSSTN